MHSKTKCHLVLLGIVAIAMIWSAVEPHDYFTWFLEVVPVFIAVPILILTYKRFRFTTLVYILIAIHAIILMIGGHYTYAEVPLFNKLRDVLELSRNHYDRVGHFAQGFVPAMIIREFLLRKSQLVRGKLLFTIVVSMCLAISASYELVEWFTAITAGDSATDFLGSQGDKWDAQWDMFLALTGAITSLLTLSVVQNKQLKKLE